MNYQDYKVEDFLYDEFFVRWVKKPGPETDHFWKTWIKENPEKIKTINEAAEIIHSLRYKQQYNPSKKDYDAVLENIMKSAASWTQLRGRSKSIVRASIIKYAAILLVIICSSAVLYYFNLERKEDVIIHTAELIYKQSSVGQKLSFTLHDGTNVKLNSGSKLTFQKVFDDNERRVRLKGEAFFEVTRDDARPFIVETNDLITTVLGTSFNIKSYDEDEKSIVAVSSGRVKVMKSHKNINSDNQYFLLNKNQMVTFNSSDNSIIKNEPVPEQIFSWKDNIIHFDHAEFDNIINVLQRWYGVEFRIKNGKSFKGRFNAKYYNEPLDLVLEGLKGEYDFEYEIAGKIVYIN